MTPSAQWLTLFSSCLHQCGVPRSTMGPLRAVTDPVQGWGNLHNLIGGSQQYPASYQSSEISTRSRKLPKLRDNNNRLGHSKYPRGTSSRALQVPKSNKLLNFNSIESSWRTQTDATYAMARTLEVLKSITPKSHQSNKCFGGRGEEEQGRTQQMNPQDLDAKASPH
jgi:hypothetical protein